MTEQPPYPRPAYAWYCLGVICFGYLFGFMDRIIVGLLTPAIQKDIGLTDTQMGVIQGLAFAVFYTLFGLPIGRAADRRSRKWLLAAGTTLWSLMTAGAGLGRSFGGLFFMRAGVGVGEATLNPCATSLIGDFFRPESRAKAFGLYTMSTALGTGVTYLGGGLVIGFIGGPTGGNTFNMPVVGEIPAWQAVFILIGLAGLVPALLMALTIREPARRDLARDGAAQPSWAETRAFLRQNRTTLLCHHFGVAFIVMAVYGWVNWLPTLFVRLHHWTIPQFSIWYGIFGGSASSVKVRDHEGGLHGSMAMGSLAVVATVAEPSDLTCELGSLDVRLTRGSDVTVTATCELGEVKVADADGRQKAASSNSRETVVAGSGTHPFTVAVRLGSATVGVAS